MKTGYRRDKPERKPKTFWPGHLFVEAVAALIVFLLLVGASLFWNEPHESVAIPTDTSYIPRPEWYFLFLFQLLRYFPGKLEPVAVVVIPGIAMLVLLLLPFLDRSSERRPWKRLLGTFVALASIVGIVFLTYRAIETTPPQITSRTQLTADGKVVYDKAGCAACHAINGQGGKMGPDLAGAGDKRTLSWLHLFIANPQAVVPGSAMPPFEGTLGREDIEAVALYLTILKKEAVPTPAATASATPTTAATPVVTPTPATTPTSLPATPVPTATATPPPTAGPTPTPGTPSATVPATPTATPSPTPPPPTLTPTPQAGGDPVAGKAVFDKNCNACHPGGGKGLGPSIKRGDYNGTATDITKVVRNGKGIMPPYNLNAISDKDLENLNSYLMTLK